MSLFIDKVTRRRKSLVLFILNVALLKLSLSSDNTQLLDHDQVKSRDLQKLLKCFHLIITFVFKDGTGDLGGWS